MRQQPNHPFGLSRSKRLRMSPRRESGSPGSRPWPPIVHPVRHAGLVQAGTRTRSQESLPRRSRREQQRWCAGQICPPARQSPAGVACPSPGFGMNRRCTGRAVGAAPGAFGVLVHHGRRQHCVESRGCRPNLVAHRPCRRLAAPALRHIRAHADLAPTSSVDALWDGSIRATALSLNARPYLATLARHRRATTVVSMAATTFLTRGDFSLS